jgi:hypothetical protein
MSKKRKIEEKETKFKRRKVMDDDEDEDEEQNEEEETEEQEEEEEEVDEEVEDDGESDDSSQSENSKKNTRKRNQNQEFQSLPNKKNSKNSKQSEDEKQAKKSELARKRKIQTLKEEEEAKEATVKKLISKKVDSKILKNLLEPEVKKSLPKFGILNLTEYSPSNLLGEPVVRMVSNEKFGNILIMPKNIENPFIRPLFR